jgi:acetate---CoA ligase (ADP-forming)
LLKRMMRPESVAIICMSTKLNTIRHLVPQNIPTNGFTSGVHPAGRGVGEIDSLSIHADIADPPENVDIAIRSVPAAGVRKALQGCSSRKIGAAVAFAGEFVELGNKEHGEQEEIGQSVRERAGSALSARIS